MSMYSQFLRFSFPRSRGVVHSVFGNELRSFSHTKMPKKEKSVRTETVTLLKSYTLYGQMYCNTPVFRGLG